MIDKVTYAVYTRTCTFLLDAQGVCVWIVSRTGGVPAEIRGAVGAQFVASMHPEIEGGLAGQLVIGAAALLVKRDPHAERLVLMRTGTIIQVEQKRSKVSVPPGALTSPPEDTLDLVNGPPLSAPPRTGVRGGDTVPPPVSVPGIIPPPPSRIGSNADGLEGDAKPMVDLPSSDGESTVTLTLPLYSDEAPLRIRNR